MTAMGSFDSSLGALPLPPAPPTKDLPPLPSIAPVPLSVKPVNTRSPVRRKPLPTTVFPPPPESRRRNNTGDSTVTGVGVKPIQVTAHRVQDSSSTIEDSPSISEAQQFPSPNQFSASASPIRHRAFDSANSISTTDIVLPKQGQLAPLPEPDVNIPEPDVRPQDTIVDEKEEDTMALKPNMRPAPLRMDSGSSLKSTGSDDRKKPQTPGSKFTSFFTRKQTAPSETDSPVTDISETRSPMPSPNPHSNHSSIDGMKPASRTQTNESIPDASSRYAYATDNIAAKVTQLETELRDISTELAGSIKREMDLEDLVERLRNEPQSGTASADRTSDYFSDSGISSIRPSANEYNIKDEMDKVKREADQHRAQLKTDLSQKWQAEMTTRRQLEAHVQLLEQRVSQSRRENNDSVDSSAKVKELEAALDDVKRRLLEERKTKENFEDLLTALRVDLEAHRSQRDNLRDEVVPKLKTQIEGLEISLADTQKQTYDFARMQQELQQLRAEKAGVQMYPIGEEGELMSPTQLKMGGLQRSDTINLRRSGSRNSLNRSNSNAARPQPVSPQALSEEFKALEQQRDALHSTVKYLLRRQDQQQRHYEKRIKYAESQRDKAYSLQPTQKGGYEREFRNLRSEINLLRKRTDDALEQKWQCEKGLAGLHMDLDRSKQETGNLRRLLQDRNNAAPESLSSSLEHSLKQLQQTRDQVRKSGSFEQVPAQLKESESRSQALTAQVKQQLQANASLKSRLEAAVHTGERNQEASAEQINDLQLKLRKLEDLITSAQTQSETAVMRHEEEIRLIGASNSAQLMRPRSGRGTPALLSPAPRSPLSPMLINTKKSPRIDKTTSGPGIPLHQALKVEYLENKVAELEKALTDAEQEMGEVVGRMNVAQISSLELESERDEALRQTRRLEAAIAAEREKVQVLLASDVDYEDY